jgi:hypothetical protein
VVGVKRRRRCVPSTGTTRNIGESARVDLGHLVNAVPADATADHPAVRALLAYVGTLGVPSSCSGANYFRCGAIETGLRCARELARTGDWQADVMDWLGRSPAGPRTRIAVLGSSSHEAIGGRYDVNAWR